MFRENTENLYVGIDEQQIDEDTAFLWSACMMPEYMKDYACTPQLAAPQI